MIVRYFPSFINRKLRFPIRPTGSPFLFSAYTAVFFIKKGISAQYGYPLKIYMDYTNSISTSIAASPLRGPILTILV